MATLGGGLFHMYALMCSSEVHASIWAETIDWQLRQFHNLYTCDVQVLTHTSTDAEACMSSLHTHPPARSCLHHSVDIHAVLEVPASPRATT